MENYNAKSCNALEKPYYKPIEAALRWCGLINYEVAILQTVGEELLPPIGAFPQWGCLRANAEKVYDAVIHGELPYGRDGKTVSTGEHVKKERLTIRHTDLKAWMAKHYPDQKPPFLFDEVERATHSAINANSFLALQVERDALRLRVEKATEVYRNLSQELNDIKGERDSLVAIVEKMKIPDARSETTYLNIIGALMELIKSPKAGRSDDASVIKELVENYGDKYGISQRNLNDKIPEAKRSLNSN